MFALLLLQLQSETLKIRNVSQPVRLNLAIDSAGLGAPQIQFQTGQGTARVWLLRARDTVLVLASVTDSTAYWGDGFVVSLDTRGDGGARPGHDDFQLNFRRVLDSSVVYRGRNGTWEPPRDDPDWRIGAERSGGGWEVSVRDERQRWILLLRLDPAWFAGDAGRPARMAFRTYDNSPSGWYSWPPPSRGLPAWSVEMTPAAWIPIR